MPITIEIDRMLKLIAIKELELDLLREENMKLKEEAERAAQVENQE